MSWCLLHTLPIKHLLSICSVHKLNSIPSAHEVNSVSSRSLFVSFMYHFKHYMLRPSHSFSINYLHGLFDLSMLQYECHLKLNIITSDPLNPCFSRHEVKIHRNWKNNCFLYSKIANVGGDCGIAAITQTQQLGGNTCSDLHHGRFNSKDSGPVSQCEGRWVGHSADLEVSEKAKSEKIT
jgi:hypothetical protein